MSSTISDMLTTIRNATSLGKPFVDLRTAKFTSDILGALKRSGFLWDYAPLEGSEPSKIRVTLKYAANGACVLRSIVSVSKPGNRVYCKVDKIPHVLQGLGCSLISTSRGVLNDKEAREQRLGGEVICNIY